MNRALNKERIPSHRLTIKKQQNEETKLSNGLNKSG